MERKKEGERGLRVNGKGKGGFDAGHMEYLAVQDEKEREQNTDSKVLYKSVITTDEQND